MQCQVYYYYILQLTYLNIILIRKNKKKNKKRREGGKKKNHQEKSCYILIDIEMIHISITRKNKADFLFDENENQAKPPLQSSPPQEKKRKQKNTYLERPPDYYTYSRVDRTERGTLVHN